MATLPPLPTPPLLTLPTLLLPLIAFQDTEHKPMLAGTSKQQAHARRYIMHIA